MIWREKLNGKIINAYVQARVSVCACSYMRVYLRAFIKQSVFFSFFFLHSYTFKAVTQGTRTFIPQNSVASIALCVFFVPYPPTPIINFISIKLENISLNKKPINYGAGI